MPKTERSAYRFPVCLICECEVDESNEHKHQGPLHDVQDVQLVPLQAIREQLLSDEAVLALARERFDYLSGYGGTRWEEAHESIRRQEEGKARLFLEAALAAFPEGNGR
jgi:hypothetical protein